MCLGPGGQPAAATFVDNMASFAWASREFDRIDVGVWKDGAPERREGAPGPGRSAAPAREVRATSSIHSVLPPVLRELFLRRERLLVHSAVLRCPCGTGILVAAPGGGGKTTTALSVLRKGAKLLGDDLNILDVEADGVRAYGFAEMLNVSEETMGFFPELRNAPSHVPEDSGSHKTVIAPQEVYGVDCLVDTCSVDVVYFVAVRGADPEAVRLKPGEAFGRLMHAQTFANGQVPNDFSFERLSDIIEHVNVYELVTGNAPAKLGEWLLANCRRHAGAADE